MAEWAQQVRHRGFGLLAALGTAGALSCGGDGPTDVSPTGNIQISTATAGSDPDPDGYTVTLEGAVRGTAAVTGAVTLERLAIGDHRVGLTDLAANCSVQGENPRSISVTSGQTATVSFQVTCTPTTAILQVTSATDGLSPDPDGYAVTVDGTERGVLTGGVVLIAERLPAGEHVVRLHGVAGNCQVEEDNPRTVALEPGTTATLTFHVICTPPRVFRIAFASNREEVGQNGADMYAVNDDGSDLTRLTHDVDAAAFDERPVWSPDASKIAFVSYRDHHQIYVMNADGSQLIQITHTQPGDENYAPDWAPGGKIIFGRGHPTDVYGVNPDGSGEVRLTTDSAYDYDPVWSPDGNKIAFLHDDGDIYVMDTDGTEPTPLTHSFRGCNERSMSWSPDGRKLAFVTCEDDPQGDIYVVNADGSGQIRLTTSPGYDYAPAWSPDGRKIAFLHQLQDPQRLVTVLYVMNPDGSGLTSLAQGTVGPPVWSPDGHKIAYAANDIFVINSDGSELKNITHRPSVYSNPAWAPRAVTP